MWREGEVSGGEGGGGMLRFVRSYSGRAGVNTGAKAERQYAPHPPLMGGGRAQCPVSLDVVLMMIIGNILQLGHKGISVVAGGTWREGPGQTQYRRQMTTLKPHNGMPAWGKGGRLEEMKGENSGKWKRA